MFTSEKMGGGGGGEGGTEHINIVFVCLLSYVFTAKHVITIVAACH